ncbi:RNA polymerase factor sigma-54 [Thorsellia kenyensis]|uniref:RNA polymerase sigma-54 factor n=1 Tax=Thorsellia kenyensis TaxID=1549888 RepID=A0ABV6C6T6_9GAMM
MIKTTLQLRTSQNFQLTPQLQQSLKFLQLSSLELEETLNQMVSENPFLTTEELINDEFTQNTSSLENLTQSNNNIPPEDIYSNDAEILDEPRFESDDMKTLYDSFNNTIQQELATDSQWEDYYQGDDSLKDYTEIKNNRLNEEDSDFLDYHNSHMTLYDNLAEQIELSLFSEKEKIIAYHIIDALDEEGYLSLSKDELILGLETEDKYYSFIEDFNSVLLRIQRFDPIGLATWSLKERLLVQLSTKTDCSIKTNAHILLSKYSTQLEKRQFTEIIKLSKLTDSEVKDALKYLASLDPFPAQKFANQQQTISAPDIIVKKRNQHIDISINNQILPKIVLDKQYVKMLQSSKKSSIDHENKTENPLQYLRQAYEEAKNILISIENRHKTLLLIANQIVVFQIDFFEKMDGQLKPMTLKDIASDVDMSESTVSRACQNKTLVCDKGLFELKYFFQSHVKNEDGENVSAEKIKTLIKLWIEEENKAKPLSDSKIESLLNSEGLVVARRTVAKYREQLGFSPSHLRKMI